MLIFEQRLWTTAIRSEWTAGQSTLGDVCQQTRQVRSLSPRNQRLDVKLDTTPKCEVSENHRNWLDCIKSGGVPNANAEGDSFVGSPIAAFVGRRLSYFLIRLGGTVLTWCMFRLTAPPELYFLYVVFAQGLVAMLFFGWLPLYLPSFSPSECGRPARVFP